MAADLGVVQHVVVDERGGVNHLDDGGQRAVVGDDRADGFGGEQEQGRAKPFAAQAEGVPGQLVDERVGVPQFLLESGVDLGQVAGDGTQQAGQHAAGAGVGIADLTHLGRFLGFVRWGVETSSGRAPLRRTFASRLTGWR